MIGETIKYPEHIYRYRFPTMNSIAALMENKCFFSTSNYYDDPFDTYLRIDFNVIDDYVNQFFENPKQAFESVMQKKIDNDQDIDFLKSINREELAKRVREVFKGIRNDLRKRVHSICFSGMPTNESLWLKYADSHKGFVIEYDTKVPLVIMSDNDIEQKSTVPQLTLGLYPMFYSNEKFDATEYARDLLAQKILGQLFPQMQDTIPQWLPPHHWESERITLIKKKCHEPDEEWRMILGSPYLIKNPIYLKWKPTRVIIGLNTDDSTRRLIIEAAKIAQIDRISEIIINKADELEVNDL